VTTGTFSKFMLLDGQSQGQPSFHHTFLVKGNQE